jgi:glycosyltransferase involved in cell wall biosynthesis
VSTETLTAPAAAGAPLAAVKRVAIVPAYNEERNVGRVLDELRAVDPGLDVVVVSDGSTDTRSTWLRRAART